MYVHFTASNFKLEDHYDKYVSIIDVIKTSGHELTREWLDEDLKRRNQRKKYSQKEYKQIWQKVKLSLMKADVVIVEGSVNSFSIGYQTAYALSHKKPVLVMTNEHEISQTIIAGEDNPFLCIAHYDASNVKEIVLDFLAKYDTSKQGSRFNMYIDREAQAFLEIESFKSGKTKARIIRDMIKKEIQNKNGL